MAFASRSHEGLFKRLAQRLREDMIDDADIFHILGEYVIDLPQFAQNLAFHVRDMLREQDGTKDIPYGEILIEGYRRCLFDEDLCLRYNDLALATDLDALTFFVDSIVDRPRNGHYYNAVTTAVSSLQ